MGSDEIHHTARTVRKVSRVHGVDLEWTTGLDGARLGRCPEFGARKHVARQHQAQKVRAKLPHPQQFSCLLDVRPELQ